MILAIVVDRQGWPIAWEVMPGNRVDGKAFQELIGLLRRRFQIGQVIVVADRGMISHNNLELLTEDSDSPFEYIVGCRMRKQKEITEEVLSRGGRYHEVSKKLRVKEVEVEGRRYVVCFNEEEAKKDKAARESMVRATIIDAISRNYNVTVIEDCVFDRIEISHKVSLLDMWMKYCDVIS